MNRLLSCILINITIECVVRGILRVARDCYGLLPFDIMLWYNLFSIWLQTNAALFYIELSIVRYLYIVIWKRMREINDDFWYAFLVSSTILVSFALSSYLFMTDRDPNLTVSIKIARHNIHRNIMAGER